MNSIVLITKDALAKSYLPTYGNKYWKTPNIDYLASKGTVFLRHYTAAPSTAMAFLAMATGRYPYEFDRKKYKHEKEYEEKTIFDVAKEKGLESHIVWSDNYMKVALPYANCFRGAQIHTLDMNQPVGPHLVNEVPLVRDENKARRTLNKLYGVLDSIPGKDVFLWLHLPHVILGRDCYGGDIDLFDEIVGYFIKKYGEESIYVSADHGNMNGQKGIYSYGFHLYEPAIRIPFITPKVEGKSFIDFPTSNTQLREILFDRTVSRRDYVISETTYFLQPKRKTAVIKDNYKLIRNKYTKTEELYDIDYDSTEERNLISGLIKDNERKKTCVVKEIYFYPKFEDLDRANVELHEIMKNVWKTGSKSQEFFAKEKYRLGKIIGSFKRFFHLGPKKVSRKD